MRSAGKRGLSGLSIVLRVLRNPQTPESLRRRGAVSERRLCCCKMPLRLSLELSRRSLLQVWQLPQDSQRQ